MKAAFIGLSYVGLPTAIIRAKHEIEVLGVDINPEVNKHTNQTVLHFIEHGLSEYLKGGTDFEKIVSETSRLIDDID